MPLPVGTMLGPYEILSAIGAGGMGEVYRARDTNLKRDVAIKTLLPAVATDPDRLARFTREARILASLNHPNIALIHGIADANGTRVFVMELIDGPTLAERIEQGAVPLVEALAIARQITGALEAAHEQGIVHRDLKPANIKLRPDGTVKVLDFGIAKTIDPPPASTAAAKQADASTTTGAFGTRAGVVFGTAAYMSPEHARGLSLDRRTDIWAFGCVLYEMLTARPPFTGQTLPEITGAILSREPEWTRLPARTPAPVVRLLRRCLEKDRKRRLADAADARLELDEAIHPVNTTADPPADRSNRTSGAVVTAIALAAGGGLIAAGVTWAVMRAGPEAPAQTSRFAIVPPAAQSLDIYDNDRNLALSPDGRHLIYRSGGSNNGGPLMLRPIDSLDGQPLAGVTNARGAFFSFDGRSVAFFDRNQIRRMPLTGEPATTISTFPGFPRGGSWGDDNTIVFATSDERTGLWRVSAAGGVPVTLTTPDSAQKELDHLFPSMLPGGRGVLFTITGLEQNAAPVIGVLDLRSGQRHTLIQGSQAEYIAPSPGSGQPGYLMYAAGGTLRAVRFDLSRLQVLGESIGIVEHLQMAVTGGANYAVARNGTLVYLPGEQAPPRSIVWVDREGREERIPAQPRTYAVPRLSSDAKRLVVEVRAEDHDLWLWDFASQRLSKLTFGSAMDQSPVWTPDGLRILFASNREDVLYFNLYAQNADGTGVPERLTDGFSSEYPTTITADGLRVLCNQLMKSQIGIVTLALGPGARARGAAPMPFISTAFDEVQAQLSPDGRFVAYQSNESGRNQVYVQPFPNLAAGRWQVTQDGGTNPMWARNGTELFYLDGSTVMTAVRVQTAGTTFVTDNPQTLFDARIYSADGTRAYDVAPDGRFILIKDSAMADSQLARAGIVVVLNWFEDLKRRLPDS